MKGGRAPSPRVLSLFRVSLSSAALSLASKEANRSARDDSNSSAFESITCSAFLAFSTAYDRIRVSLLSSSFRRFDECGAGELSQSRFLDLSSFPLTELACSGW